MTIVTNTKTSFDTDTNPDYNVSATTNTADSKLIQHLATTSVLVPHTYDYISCTYTGSDLTSVVYKTGGSGGTTVRTLTMTYTANVLQTVSAS